MKRQNGFLLPGKWWRIAAALLLVGAVASLSGVRSWPDQILGMRPANKSEQFYRYIAQQLAEPSLCKKIPWSVMSPGGFFIAPSYERSECYDFIAGRTKNPWLCWKVRRLGAFNWLSEQTSVWSCLNHAIHGWDGGIAISQSDLIYFFTQMGYDPDTLHLEGLTPPVVSVKDIYRQLPDRPDIVAQIERAIGPLDTPSDLPSHDIEGTSYLADIAAVATTDFRWCLRIPDGLPLAGERAKFRDWCLLTVATNTRNAKLCRLIPIRAGGSDPRMSPQALCSFQANSAHAGNTRYGPEVPADDDRTRALITMLNYPIPHAKDLPPEQIYTAYDRFLDELQKVSDPQHMTARLRFIDRVQRVPNNN